MSVENVLKRLRKESRYAFIPDDILKSIIQISQEEVSNPLLTLIVDDPEAKRNFIRKELEKVYGEFPALTERLLKDCFRYYDYYFTGGLISKRVSPDKIKLTFDDRLTSTAGYSVPNNSKLELQFSTSIFSALVPEVFDTKVYRPIIDQGINVRNRMEALILTFEHELIHGIISLLNHEEADSHGPEFKRLVFNYFKHTEYKHNLTVCKLGEGFVKLINPRLDQEVIYVSNKKHIEGRIIKINPKNVKVQTSDGTVYVINKESLYTPSNPKEDFVSDPDEVILCNKFSSTGWGLSGKSSPSSFSSFGSHPPSPFPPQVPSQVSPTPSFSSLSNRQPPFPSQVPSFRGFFS